MFFVCLFLFFRLYCCLEPRAQHDQEACLVHHTQRVRHHVTGGCRAWTRCIAACTHAHARHSAAPTTTTVAVTVDWLLVCCGPVSPTPNPPAHRRYHRRLPQTARYLLFIALPSLPLTHSCEECNHGSIRINQTLEHRTITESNIYTRLALLVQTQTSEGE